MPKSNHAGRLTVVSSIQANGDRDRERLRRGEDRQAIHQGDRSRHGRGQTKFRRRHTSPCCAMSRAPRWRQTFRKTRSTRSAPRAISRGAPQRSTARTAPGSASWSTWPRHSGRPRNRCLCSASKTPRVVINLRIERVCLDFPVRTGGLVELTD